MHQVLSFLSTAWYVVRQMAGEMTQGGGDYEDERPMASAAGDDSYDYSPLPPNVLPPAEHNAWGTMQDYSLGMPDD